MSVEVLDQFYRRRCNGIWEHTYGIDIETCDNPGWVLTLSDPELNRSVTQSREKGMVALPHHGKRVKISFIHEEARVLYGICIFGMTLEDVVNEAAAIIRAYSN